MYRKDLSTIQRNESPKKRENRKDYRGTWIIKGQKSHKVTFLDQVTKCELKESIFVENYKEYNIDMSNPSENCSCKCLVV